MFARTCARVVRLLRCRRARPAVRVPEEVDDRAAAPLSTVARGARPPSAPRVDARAPRPPRAARRRQRAAKARCCSSVTLRAATSTPAAAFLLVLARRQRREAPRRGVRSGREIGPAPARPLSRSPARRPTAATALVRPPPPPPRAASWTAWPGASRHAPSPSSSVAPLAAAVAQARAKRDRTARRARAIEGPRGRPALARASTPPSRQDERAARLRRRATPRRHVGRDAVVAVQVVRERRRTRRRGGRAAEHRPIAVRAEALVVVVELRVEERWSGGRDRRRARRPRWSPRLRRRAQARDGCRQSTPST